VSHYSLSVALFDFVPVLVSTAAYGFMAVSATRARSRLSFRAWVGVALIATGGITKASWKLLDALDEQPPQWLGDLLLPLMAMGLIAIYSCLHEVTKKSAADTTAAMKPDSITSVLLLATLLSGLLALLQPHTRTWFIGLLVTTITANTALVLRAASASIRVGHYATAACFLYNGLALFALGGLSRLPAETASAWVQEALNLSAQAALALGAWRMSKCLPHPHFEASKLSTRSS
jgi:hypothetical protein